MNWRDRAACSDDNLMFPHVDPEAFYPTYKTEHSWDEARWYCEQCPVTAECLADALAHETPTTVEGMWGGKEPDERRDILRGRAIEQPPKTQHARECPVCKTRFQTPQANRMLCSDVCREIRERERAAAYRVRTRAKTEVA